MLIPQELQLSQKNVHELYRKSLIVLLFNSCYSARFSNFKHYFFRV